MAGIMASDFRVRRGTTRHRKLRTLVARFGGAAGWAVVELWDYATDHAADGKLGALTDEQIGALTSGALLPGGAAAFGSALIEVGLVDRGPDGMVEVHDWLEEQEHIAYLLQKREAGEAGGKKSAKLRRERDGSAQPKHSPKRPPKHSRSTPEAPTEAPTEAAPSLACARVPDRTGPDLKSGPCPDRPPYPPSDSQSGSRAALPSPLPSATATASAASGPKPPKTRRARAATLLHIRRGKAVLRGPDPGLPTPEQIDALAATLPPEEDDPEYRGPGVKRGE